MKKLNILVWGLISASSLIYLGCGGKAAQPITATNAAFVLGNLSASLGKLATSNTVPGLPMNGVTVSSLSAKNNGCETVNPNPLVDADNDGIAAYKKYTFDCSGSLDSGYLYTQKGTVESRDLDETVDGVFGGMRVDFDLPVFSNVEVATGNKYEYSHNGFWLYKNVGGTLVSSSSYTGKNKYAYNGLQNDYTYTYAWDYKMTPDDINSPWTTGKIEMSGSFELAGKFVREDAQNNHLQSEGSWVISYKSSNMTFDHSCAKFYKTGSYIMEDSASKIEVRYACSTAKLYVNGVESDWWTP